LENTRCEFQEAVSAAAVWNGAACLEGPATVDKSFPVLCGGREAQTEELSKLVVGSQSQSNDTGEEVPFISIDVEGLQEVMADVPLVLLSVIRGFVAR
jgi:hypothetical protein